MAFRFVAVLKARKRLVRALAPERREIEVVRARLPETIARRHNPVAVRDAHRDAHRRRADNRRHRHARRPARRNGGGLLGAPALDFRGVLRLTFTSTPGATTTETIRDTVPLHRSLDFTAQTQEQRALICDVSHLLRSGASLQEIVDKLTQLLRTL